MLGIILALAATAPQLDPAATLPSAPPGTHKKIRAKLTISKEGSVTACRIVRSSGDQRIDDATCNMLIKHSHFAPAHDRFGNPVEDSYLTPPIDIRVDK